MDNPSCFYADLGMGECDGALIESPRFWLSDHPKVRRTARCELHSAMEKTRTFNFWHGVPTLSGKNRSEPPAEDAGFSFGGRDVKPRSWASDEEGRMATEGWS